ncbi:HK97 gp10 family phage protein [candidate division WOR-3 bacterium]|nr:HK97 gp10 family phage protein [candidate division WOR-3 bacterium]
MIDIIVVQIEEAFQRLSNDLDGVVQEMLEIAAMTAETKLKEAAPVDTGELRASIGFSINEEEAIVGSDRPHAWILRGMKAMTIVPRTAKMLRFEIDGKEIFAKSVDHPGFEDIMGQTESEIQNELPKIASDVIRGRL